MMTSLQMSMRQSGAESGEALRVPLASVCDIIMGQAPAGDTYNTAGNGLALIAGAGDFSAGILTPKKFTNKPTKLSEAGDIVLSIRASIGDKVWADQTYCLGRGVAALRAKPSIDSGYLWHWLSASRQTLMRKAKGATFLQVNRSDIGDLLITVPPLEEQRRIAAILDKADDVRTKRRQAVAQLDKLSQSIFLSLFGDPSRNPHDWPIRPLGDLSVKFSDGPFGSNLKSSHYTDQGVQVIRLQNIGVGELIDDNRAFISVEHFESLRKHECLPGDVIVGTLGEPNLRSFVQPASLQRALNKADCVQIRPDSRVATSAYINGLLNTDSANRMAASLILGQTRGRISMGRLRKLVVPLPPISLQEEFGNRISALMRLKSRQGAQIVILDALFSSLQHRAFEGEL